MSPAAQRWTISFTGHVQGVGFRYTVHSIARNYEVSGFVRNLPDGSVELIAEGARAELQAFLAEIRDRFSNHVKNERRDERPAMGDLQGFEIRR